MLGPLLGVLIGCGTASSPIRWARDQGGILHDQRQQRADSALAMLTLPSGVSSIHVHVLDTGSVGAYAWPDAQIFVTRGLVDLLPQPELAAAIAHEAGHLLDGGHLGAPLSLHGRNSDPDAEIRADAIGVRLLSQRGIETHTMSAMLKKVAEAAAPGCRPSIRRRISALLIDR